MTKELIAVRQLPIIEERLKDLAADIDRQVEEAIALTVTPETVKAVKEVRAGLNKQFRELEDQRKTVKKAILEPYEQFDLIYKKYVSVRFDEADAELKRKINDVESGLKREKEDELRTYFREYADSLGLDWITFERGNFNITLSKSVKALKAEAAAFLDQVASDVRFVSIHPDSAEVMAEYKKTLRLGYAVETVENRKKEVEREREAQERRLAAQKEEEERVRAVREAAEKEEVISAPKKAEEKLTLTFSVTDTRSRLKTLKAFLDNNQYDYE